MKEELLDRQPPREHIKKNDDGSEYIPISIIEDQLDEIFDSWDFQLDRETFGRKEMTGCGTLYCSIGGRTIYRTGTAAVAYDKELRLDYPALEARCLLNAAKKLGKWFGRDLNRAMEDAPIKTIQVEKREDISENEKDEIDYLLEMDSVESIEEYIGQSEFKWRHKSNPEINAHIKNLRDGKKENI